MPLPRPAIYYYTSPTGSNPIKQFIDSLTPQQQTKIYDIINGMRNKLAYSFDQDLKKRLKEPQFEDAWKKSEAEYDLANPSLSFLKKIAQALDVKLQISLS